VGLNLTPRTVALAFVALGTALVTLGLWLMWPPVALSFLGAGLMVVGLAGIRVTP
jgi:hypothetical protein